MNGVPTMKPLPYQLLLNIEQHPFVPDGRRCGAVIVSPQYAVTAYHCVQRFFGGMVPNDIITVYAGAYNLQELHQDKNVQKRGVQWIHLIDFKNGSSSRDECDCTYKKQRGSYGRYLKGCSWSCTCLPDLAVLHLDEPLQMNDFVTPACLPTKEVPMNEECIVSGWGETYYGSSLPITLQAASISISKVDNCNTRWAGKDKNPGGDYDLCGFHYTKDACRGDSGGPLVCKTNGGATLYGIVSRGPACNPDSPVVGKFGLYGNVYYAKNQIEALIGNDNP